MNCISDILKGLIYTLSSTVPFVFTESKVGDIKKRYWYQDYNGHPYARSHAYKDICRAGVCVEQSSKLTLKCHRVRSFR